MNKEMKNIISTLVLVSLVLFSYTQSNTINEGFENWPPEEWSIHLLGDASTGWMQDFESISYSGDHSAYSRISNDQCDNWMVSPQVDIFNSNYELIFYDIHEDAEYYDKISVLVSSGSGDPQDGDFVELYTQSIPNVNWQEKVIDLSVYENESIYVAFRFEGTWHSWFIDEVSISPDSFIDGAITSIYNPTGVASEPGSEDVVVTIYNNGTTTIDDLEIGWDINGATQTPYNGTSINLLSGESIDITLGNFDFDSSGLYTITTQLTLAGDFDDSNDMFQGTYTISEPKDGKLFAITPEAMSPFTGILDVSVLIENTGFNIIDTADVYWTVDGIDQTTFSVENLNLEPGESTELSIGQYDFNTGVYEIEATLDAFGDTNDQNNSYLSYAAIDTLWESFEGRQYPPDNWSIVFGVRDNSNFGEPAHGEYYYTSAPDNNLFGSVTDTIYTPLLDIESGDKFRFKIQTNPFLATTTTIVWKDGLSEEVSIIETIDPNPITWQQVEIDISSAVGSNYIGIISSVEDEFPGQTKFDLFTSDAKLKVFNKDLEILDGDMYFLAKQDEVTSFDCLIRNSGSEMIQGSDYTVKLMESPGVELASSNGMPINPWEELTLTVSHTFIEISSHNLYFEISYADDVFENNNTFRTTDVYVVPNTVVMSDIGQENVYQSMNYPFNSNGSTMSLGEDDMSQTIYYNEEIATGGNIYGFTYKYNNMLGADEVKGLPLKVWVSQTATENLNDGWFPIEDLILVFNDTIDILPGNNREVYIPFDTPFTYTGIGNLVIQDFQYDPAWPPSILRMKGSQMPEGDTRTIAVMDVYQLDPIEPPIFFNAFSDIPQTSFVIDPINEASTLSGTVYNTENVPLENATVIVQGTGIETTTSVNGSYSLPALPYGDYSVLATIVGHNDSTIAITLNSESQVQDFYLVPKTQVDVTGTVFGSDDLSAPLENVTVTAIGYTDDSDFTDELGEFVLSNMFGIASYEITFSLYGYYDYTTSVDITDSDIDLGDIVLQQEFISPYDVNAFVQMDTISVLHWKSPLSSEKEKLQNDYGVNSYSYTNEPNENVWLGNLFEIDDTTTIVSVDIQTGIYENAIDFVTVDVFNIDDELISTSEPFLIYVDSIHTVDIANVVVTDDIYAMLHWQDNPISTNALALDYSDENIPNTAVIKYPGNPAVLFTEFIGGDAPNMSFHVRVNTLTDGNNNTNETEPSYNVYRGLADEFPNVDAWEMLNTDPIDQLSMDDQSWLTLNPDENYRYAVETIYNEGLSELTFSNTLSGPVIGVDELGSANISISIYPNPANDKLNLSFSSESVRVEEIRILDSRGRQIDFVDGNNIAQKSTLDYDTSKLTAGLYTLYFVVEGIPITKKFIIEH